MVVFASHSAAAREIVAWMKGDGAKENPVFGWDRIVVEIRRRWPMLPVRDVDFIAKKSIIILGME
jgi:hypothetical protein